MGEHGSHGPDPTAVLVLLLAVPAVAGYLVAVRREAGRRSWPRGRTLCWLAGALAVAVGTSGPLAAAAHGDGGGPGDFRAHAVAHVLVGMLGPLLLALGSPVSLALRALPVPAARRLSGVLRSRPLRVLTEPATVVLLDLGGLWLLYRTPLLGWTHTSAGVHLLVHVHLVLAGYLLAAVLVGRDPLPHRRSHRHRAIALVVAMAAHGVLAKSLYAAPPTAVDPATVQAGAMVMYYAGDAVELALAVLLCRGWFAAAARPRVRSSVLPSG
ncbi:putative membrane protein [Friedmanniella luteola]|uniref:Putative membrane protein n=1 Tax=Friedmanniella luteola TaxID=546871 RepID=A0A1H1YC24_9ACTN|nr:cytochrome c oxidase assembly protein [Friedmanniella luteola]SDT18987.1 putative membrane protein [Friedmanniella luteola]